MEGVRCASLLDSLLPRWPETLPLRTPALLVLMLLALALAACDSAPPTAGIVESGARLTPTPVPTATPISTPTPVPIVIPTSTATPMPTATPTESTEPSPTPRATTGPPMAQTSPETDREALVALYHATGGPHWNSNDKWLSDVPVSEWFGVTTDDNGRVTELRLSENLLSGEIPPELGNLANLEGLRLNDNWLSGEIPPELGNLANLAGLGLHDNRLIGEIPPELGNLARLTVLSLRGNQLSGEIPRELGNLAKLISAVPRCAGVRTS